MSRRQATTPAHPPLSPTSTHTHTHTPPHPYQHHQHRDLVTAPQCVRPPWLDTKEGRLGLLTSSHWALGYPRHGCPLPNHPAPHFSSLFIFSGDRTVSVYDNRRQGTQSGRPNERPGMRDTPRQQNGLPWGCSRFMREPRWLTCRMREGGGAKESRGDALYRTKINVQNLLFCL